MILTPIRRYGAMILMLLTLVFSSEVLAKTHTTTASQKSHLTKASNKQVSSKQEYSRNSAKSSSLPDLRKYPSGTPRKKAFLRTVMPYITSQNAAIAAERNWLISKQYQGQWSPAERARLKDIAKRYKVKWSGNTRKIPWNTLLERVDIIPTSMVATMARTMKMAAAILVYFCKRPSMLLALFLPKNVSAPPPIAPSPWR